MNSVGVDDSNSLKHDRHVVHWEQLTDLQLPLVQLPLTQAWITDIKHSQSTDASQITQHDFGISMTKYWQIIIIFIHFNPLMGRLEPQSNEPVYNNIVITRLFFIQC